MRKLFALTLALTLVSGLYGFKLGIGPAYENIAVTDQDPFLAIKIDARVPLISMIDVRAVLINFSMPENAKSLKFGTFTESDLMIKFPMEGSFKPYLALGLWLNQGLEDAPLDYMQLYLKAALGGEMGFGGVNVYVEGGLNKFAKIKGVDGTQHPVFVQLGVILPVGK